MAESNKRKRDEEHGASADEVERQTMPSPAQQRDEQKPEPIMPFRFPDLPAELRNNVYEKVLEDEPIARLSRKTKKAKDSENSKNRELMTSCRLICANKQVQDEFQAIVNDYAPVIQTTVRNFHFGHIVTFMNRLSDAELDSITTKRTMKIELVMDYWNLGWNDKKQLQRWVSRADHPTKKGVNVAFEYECALSLGLARFMWPYVSGPKGGEEWRKIQEAMNTPS